MTEQSIQSEDMSLKRVFVDFYRVPDYQREYVWGEADAKGERGNEVEQFLSDIYYEFDDATKDAAPEYFIGTIVVCASTEDVYDLIDGQQRITTAFLVLCAIRDLLTERGEVLPADLAAQIAASDTNWRGDTTYRTRLDLQYEDSRGVLNYYAAENRENTAPSGTRSTVNISEAYGCVRDFLVTQFHDDHASLRRFYGYFSNKVKLIRIQTPNVAKALKIFETINDRGVGLDAMDLLKNLLFMSAQAEDFNKLKETWKALTDAIYRAKEKPLRFLRYFVLASYEVDTRLQEDAIYDWFLMNERQTGHKRDPIKFALRLHEAALAYANFVEGKNPSGELQPGIMNTRYLGGSAVRQHYILLLAGRHLSKQLFSDLTAEVENLMFIYLITATNAKDYERSIVAGAATLRYVKSDQGYEDFCSGFFVSEKAQKAAQFDGAMKSIGKGSMRAFRMRYLLAKLTQYFDVKAYGNTGGHGALGHYMDGRNDIEHIYPETPSPEAAVEFCETPVEAEVTQKLGNLMLLEKSINQGLSNKQYSLKRDVYSKSQYLLVKCQASKQSFGVADQITRVAASIPTFQTWNPEAVEARQSFLAKTAHDVWGVPLRPGAVEPQAH